MKPTPNARILKQIDILGNIFYLKGDEQKYYCVDTIQNYTLDVTGVYYIPLIYEDRLPENWQNRKMWRFLSMTQLDRIGKIVSSVSTLSGPYMPAANLAYAYHMNLVTPDTMDEPIKEALRQLRNAVGNVQEFVAERLNYSVYELSQVLSNEQIDAVAIAIYNAEVRNQGMIIGDQTGVGKGRVAAAFLRYAIEYHHKKPIFFTKTKELFPDIIRDLKALHCNYNIFTTNSPCVIKDDDDKVLLKFNKADYLKAIKDNKIPKEYDLMVTTYSQYSSERYEKKVQFIRNVTMDNVIVMDEAHEAGGEQRESYTRKDADGNISLTDPKQKGFGAKQFTDYIVPNSKACMYLSATFAKRPVNMPVYAVKTCFCDAFPVTDSRYKEKIQQIFRYGGNAVEEIASASLVEYGQMMRRERKNDIQPNFITLDADGAAKYEGIQNEVERHSALFNNILAIIRKLRDFERRYVDPYLEYINQNFKKADKEDNTPMDSDDYDKYKEAKRTTQLTRRLFDIMNVAMFSLKAEAVGQRALYYLERGCKPVIGFSNTLDSILPKVKPTSNVAENDANTDADTDAEDDDTEEMDTSDNAILSYGDNYNADFIKKFSEILNNLLKYKVQHHGKENKIRKNEKKRVRIETLHIMSLKEMDEWWQKEVDPYGTMGADTYPERVFTDIRLTLSNGSMGIPISPIDVIRKIIEDAGYSVAECTGRKSCIDYKDNTFTEGKFQKIPSPITKKFFNDNPPRNTSECYNYFNDNKADCLFINATGSTGKSAHAIPTKAVPKEEVKRRVLIIAQAESDINDEVQKQGRINRTGQLEHIPPIIEYIFSFLPTERKMMMRLKKKLRSLSANTSADQDANTALLEGEDVYNIFGDKAALSVFKDMFHNNYSYDTENFFMDNPLKARKNKKTGEIEPHASESNFCQTAFSRIQMLPIERQEDFFSNFNMEYNWLVENAKENGEYLLEASDRDYQAHIINEYCIRTGNNEKSRFGSSTFMTQLSIKSQKKLPKANSVELPTFNQSKVILENLKANYNIAQKEIELQYQNSKPERIEKLNGKIDSAKKQMEQLKEAIKLLTEQLDPTDTFAMEIFKKKIEDTKTKIKEEEEKIKELEQQLANVDSDIEEQIKASKSKNTALYLETCNMVKNLIPGSVYQQEDGNLLMVTSMIRTCGDDVNLLSAPANISIKIATTDTEMAHGISTNLANTDEKRTQINKIISLPKLTSADWDRFISSDKYREKVYMITGNIIPYINNILKGSIVHYTMDDNTSQMGFQVKLELDPNTQRLRLPMIINGVLVDLNKYKTEVKKAILNGGRIDFAEGTELLGSSIWVTANRNGDDVTYMLKFISHSVKEAIETFSSNINYDYGEFSCFFDDLDFLLDNLAKVGFSAKVPFHLLDQYGINLGGEKYQMQDWKPLSYDKKKIPANPKHMMQKLFVKLLK